MGNWMTQKISGTKPEKNAEITLQNDYLPKVFDTKYPPKGYVYLGGMIMNTFL